MNFEIDSTTRQILATVQRFVTERLQPLEDEVEREGALAPEKARSLFEEARALGLYAMNMPSELGGGGLNAVQMCLVEEQADGAGQEAKNASAAGAPKGGILSAQEIAGRVLLVFPQDLILVMPGFIASPTEL